MKLIIQPKFSWMATRDIPSINKYKRTEELLKNFNRDYAIEVYFKENRKVGHKSRYTMGELAHHLMVEGQFSLSANRKGRPHKQMSVVYGKNGRPRRNRDGKYFLQNETGYKKIWNFVKTGAQKHHNWRDKVRQMTTAVLFNRLALFYMNKPLSSANFYNEMKALARQILSDLKQELLALEYPALDAKTIKKKKSDKILIESKKLFNALSVRVVPLKKSTPKKRLNFGRKFVSKNAPFIYDYERGVVNEMLKQHLNRGEYFENLDENGNPSQNRVAPSSKPSVEYPYSDDDAQHEEDNENVEYHEDSRDEDQDVGTSHWDTIWRG